MAGAVRRGALVRVRRGVYARRDFWADLPQWEKERLSIEAHFLATGGSAVYSHVSAARLAGVATWDGGADVHVTVPYSVARTSHAADVVPHRLHLPDEDVLEIKLSSGRFARATSLERTVADCARVLDLERALVIGDHALRRGATVDGILAAAFRTGALRGQRRIERLAALVDGRSESAGETRTRLALLESGLPEPVLQHSISTAAGIFRADFAWPDLLVVLEFDGEAKYVDYRPTPEVLRDERIRENAMVEEGWTIARARWADLAIPGAIEGKVRAAFARARKLAS